jgi:ATP-binding cassette subfamily B protein
MCRRARGRALRRVSTEQRLRDRAQAHPGARLLVGFIITATFGALLWGLYQGTQAVVRGDISAGHLGQTVVYVIILVGSGGGAERGLRRPAARRRRHRAADGTAGHASSPVADPGAAGAAAGGRGSAVVFDARQFHYPSRPRLPALLDFTLEVAPGETVALVGPSGAGKSTVFQLLLRFYDVQQRQVTLDGVPVREAGAGRLRQRIGIVPQDSTDLLDQRAGEHPLRPARGQRRRGHRRRQGRLCARLHQALPEGYDTYLGERGVRLSGGQRQRIASPARC